MFGYAECLEFMIDWMMLSCYARCMLYLTCPPFSLGLLVPKALRKHYAELLRDEHKEQYLTMLIEVRNWPLAPMSYQPVQHTCMQA